MEQAEKEEIERKKIQTHNSFAALLGSASLSESEPESVASSQK